MRGKWSKRVYSVYYGRSGTKRTFNNYLWMKMMNVSIFKKQMRRGKTEKESQQRLKCSSQDQNTAESKKKERSLLLTGKVR